MIKKRKRNYCVCSVSSSNGGWFPIKSFVIFASLIFVASRFHYDLVNRYVYTYPPQLVLRDHPPSNSVNLF